MGILSKLFGRNPSNPPPAPGAPTPSAGAQVACDTQPQAARPAADPACDPNMIRVFDAYGRELFITKQQWRDSVLIGHIKKVWDHPAELAAAIIQALQDGFGADMIQPAEHLATIDPDPERAAVLLAIIYRDQKRLGDAEKALRRFIAAHGESGVVLTNLAKIQGDRGDEKLSLETLWRGLQLDPNQDNAFGWYHAVFKEREGEAGGLAAFRRIAALPGSWRAQVWLARDALQRRQLDEALSLYAEALGRAPRPVPTDMLQQISGDLGMNGHLPELLRVTEPHFQIDVHGLTVGNNLIKARLDLGEIGAARALLKLHYAQKRPDWKETLAFWETEIAKARVSTTTRQPREKMAMLTCDGPIWLPDDSPAAELFSFAGGTSIRVAFLGSSAEQASADMRPVHQLSDAPGRLSRAIPLFLAQEVRFHGGADVRVLVPWLVGDSPAFVFSGVTWTDGDAAGHARAGDTPADYVVVTHLRTLQQPWTIEWRLIRTLDTACLATARAPLALAQPEAGVREVTRDLLAQLQAHAQYEPAAPPALYRTPTGPAFITFLLRIEQLLAVRCSAEPGVPPSFLHGAREILDGDLQLCLDRPEDATARLVLLQTIRHMKKVHADVVQEYREKLQLLQRDHPLAEPAHAVTQRMVAEVFAG